MSRVTASAILKFAESVIGKKLQTLHRKNYFSVEIQGDALIYTPLSTGKPRLHQKKVIHRVCVEFNKAPIDQRLMPSHYVSQSTVNASYTLKLIAMYLESISGKGKS